MTATTLQRMLEYPHRAVFEKGPADELVFRLQHADTATWEIAEGVMTASAGAMSRTYDLAAITVSGLIAALRADGFTVQHTSSRFDGYSALVLVEGKGRQDETNGDHVTAFTSLMWALFTAYARQISAASEQIRQALLQMVIGTAEGEWLDLWGSLYSVQRLPGEGDVTYRARIPREAFRLRVNALAIEQAIKDATGFDVRIAEPWTEIFTLDDSVLSGPHKLYDGSRVGYHLIEPVVDGVIDWDAVLAVINRNRAAGIQVLGPKMTYGSVLVVGGDYVVHAGIMVDVVNSSRLEDIALLDYGALEDVSVLNHTSLQLQEIVRTSASYAEPQVWAGFSWAEAGTWANTFYVVSSTYSQDYQVFYSSVAYEGQFWGTLGRAWSTAPDETWASYNAIVTSGYFDES